MNAAKIPSRDSAHPPTRAADRRADHACHEPSSCRLRLLPGAPPPRRRTSVRPMPPRTNAAATTSRGVSARRGTARRRAPRARARRAARGRAGGGEPGQRAVPQRVADARGERARREREPDARPGAVPCGPRRRGQDANGDGARKFAGVSASASVAPRPRSEYDAPRHARERHQRGRAGRRRGHAGRDQPRSPPSASAIPSHSRAWAARPRARRWSAS